MTCMSKWKQNSGCAGERTRVDPSEVDGAARCRNWRCNSPLRRDGTCPHGCPQEVTRCPVCHRPSVIAGEPCENPGCGLNVVLEAAEVVEHWLSDPPRGARGALKSVKGILESYGPPCSTAESHNRLTEALGTARSCLSDIWVRVDYGDHVAEGTWDCDNLFHRLEHLCADLDQDDSPEGDESAESDAYSRYAEKRAKHEPRPPVAQPNLPAGEHISRGVVYAPLAPPAVPPTVYCGVAPHAVPYARRQGLRPWRGMQDDISLVRTWPDPAAAFTHDGSFLLEVDTTTVPGMVAYRAADLGAIGMGNNVPPSAIKRVWKVDWMTSADAAAQNALILGDPGHGWVQAAVPLEDSPAAPRAPG